MRTTLPSKAIEQQRGEHQRKIDAAKAQLAALQSPGHDVGELRGPPEGPQQPLEGHVAERELLHEHQEAPMGRHRPKHLLTEAAMLQHRR